MCSENILIIVIIIIRHQLDLDRPVVASSNSLFKGLASRLGPSGLQFSIIFGILLLFIIFTCRGKFDFIFLVSRQLVRLSSPPKFLHSFCCQKGWPQKERREIWKSLKLEPVDNKLIFRDS